MSETESASGEGVLPGLAPTGVPGGAPGAAPRPAEEVEFAAFYRDFVPTLVAFLMWQGASAAVAADLVQETMVKAYRNWSRIEHPAAWARRTASRDLVRHQVHASGERPFAEVPEATALLPRPEETAALEQRHEVLRLLAELPWRQRQVMAWTYDGYSPADIAEELGIESAAVRASLRKARQALAARLRELRELREGEGR